MFLSVVTLAAVTGLSSPNDAYRAAIATMSAQPVPAYVTYRAELESGSATIQLQPLPDGRIKPRIEMGMQYDPRWRLDPYSRPSDTLPAVYYPPASFEAAYRASDGLASIATGPQRHALTSVALFDPTWNGILLWLRRGLLATIERGDAAPAPVATPGAAKDPKTILTVYAFDPNAYRVEDAGIGWCGNDPGRILGMTALRDVERHPLQRLVVDAVDGRVCSVRFGVDGTEGATRFQGYVELQFGMAAGYDLISEGYIDVGAFQGSDRIGFAHVRFHYRDVHTPVALPDATFSQP